MTAQSPSISRLARPRQGERRETNASLPQVWRDPWAIAAGLWALLIVTVGIAPTQPLVAAVASQRETLATTAGHFLEFAIRAALLVVVQRRSRRRARRLLATFTLVATFGGAVELVQVFLPYRDGQIYDVAVNALGGATGLLLASVAARAARR